MKNKEYVMLKTGGFYLSSLYLDNENYDLDFLKDIEFTSKIDRALRIEKTKATYLQKILYINAGVDCTIEEIEGE